MAYVSLVTAFFLSFTFYIFLLFFSRLFLYTIISWYHSWIFGRFFSFFFSTKSFFIFLLGRLTFLFFHKHKPISKSWEELLLYQRHIFHFSNQKKKTIIKSYKKTRKIIKTCPELLVLLYILLKQTVLLCPSFYFLCQNGAFTIDGIFKYPNQANFSFIFDYYFYFNLKIKSCTTYTHIHIIT